MKKRRIGDRKDGYKIREVDIVHVILANTAPSRVANEAVTTELIDLTNLDLFLAKKNEGLTERKYTYMHVLIAALSKLVDERPKLNRFIANCNYYQRHKISFAFVARRYFKEESDEGLIVLEYDKDDKRSVLEQMHEKIIQKVYLVREENEQNPVNFLTKVPSPIMRLIGRILRSLDKRGKMPESITKIDPSYTTCFITNLGSIKMNATYHHLSDWGTNSVFLIMGEKKKQPIFNDDGSYELKTMLPLSFTIDERIADGFYFNNSIKLLKNYLENPSILEVSNE